MKELMATNGFYLRYMWFLSLLLLFFIIFAVVYHYRKDRFNREDEILKPVKNSLGFTLKLLFGLGFLTFLGSALLLGLVKATTSGVTDMEPLFTLGNIIQFKVTGIFSFAVYFSLGIITYKRKWIERGVFPGHFRVWTISLVVVTIVYIYLYEQLLSFRVIYKDVPTLPIEIITGVSLFFFTKFLAISAIGFFTSIVQKAGVNSNIISKRLSSTAYEIYLGHYIFVIVLQLLLFAYPGIPVLLKFIIASIGAVACAHIAALYLVKPHPRLTVAVVFAIFLLMAVFIRI